MKKIAFALIALLVCGYSTSAQKINYERTLAEAERLSRENNKILCILVTMPPPAHADELLPGLKDPGLAAKINENFVSYRVDRADTSSRAVITKYRMSGFPGFVFVDSKGGVIFQKWGNWPLPMLTAMFDEAIAASKDKSLVDYDAQYDAGDRSREFLKSYINKRISAGITNNAGLAELYVNTMPVSDLNNYGEVLFILKAGPLADGRAYSLLQTNRKMVDSVYKRELYDVRFAINNRIIENTMFSAIGTKNIQRAYSASAFTLSTWRGEDPMQGRRNSDKKLLQYFTGVKDTAGFLRHAANHYDRYYMNISVDSIRKMDQKNMERASSNAREQAMLSTPGGANIRSVSYSFAANSFATELNNGAWSVYMTGTRNAPILAKAMLWSKRSIELNPQAGFYDTLAHVLYRLGFYAEAEETQQKAIQMTKTARTSSQNMEEELLKMKNRTL